MVCTVSANVCSDPIPAAARTSACTAGTSGHASAFVPDNASWVDLEKLDGLTIQAADTETLLAMKIAAERDKDTLDIARLLRRLNITNAADAVDLAYGKYGEHSIPLAAGRDNYLIVVDDALDAAATLKPED